MNKMQLEEIDVDLRRLVFQSTYGFVEVENFVTIIDRIAKGAEQTNNDEQLTHRRESHQGRKAKSLF